MRRNSRDLATIEKNLANDINTISCESELVATANTNIESLEVNTYNVVMKLEGSDPHLKNESIIIGAHYDHLGFGGRGSGSLKPNEHTIHNGADDNASGVALVMLLAKKLAKQKEQLKRSIVVALFGAEEQGIVGSKHFVSHTPNDVGKMVAMLNFDMVGRLDEERKLQIGGVGTLKQGEELIKAASNPDSLKLSLSKGGFGISDHAVFCAKQLPVLYFTTGIHADYHTPYDTAEKIDYNGIRSIELLAEDIVKQLTSLAILSRK
jgi:Zn-dependent M28 family amino/carboxypeptidase